MCIGCYYTDNASFWTLTGTDLESVYTVQGMLSNIRNIASSKNCGSTRFKNSKRTVVITVGKTIGNIFQ